MLGYEAFTEEYQEEQDLKMDMVLQAELERSVLAKIQDEMKSTRQWAPLYRKYEARLREIVQNEGHILTEEGKSNGFVASELLRDLFLGQTLPDNDLNVKWVLHDGQWTETDSYTGEPILDDVSTEAKMLGDQVAPKIPHLDDSVTLSIVEAYRGLKNQHGDPYTEEEIQDIVRANQGIYEDDDEPWYEDREREDGPIAQENTQMLHIDWAEIMEIRRNLLELRGWKSKIEWLNQEAWHYETQNLLAVAMMLNLDWHVEEVRVPIYGNLLTFARYWADDIMDEILDLTGAPHITETTWEDIDQAANEITRQIVSTFDPEGRVPEEIRKELKLRETEIQWSAAYARGVMQALGNGKSDLTGEGYHNWRWETSKSGSYSYDRTYAAEIAEGRTVKQARKTAWRAFHHARVVKGIDPHGNGLVVVSEATGNREVLSWGLSAWKITMGEIFLSPDERGRLMAKLRSLGWGRKVQEVL